MIVLVCPLSRIPRPKLHLSFALLTLLGARLGVPTAAIFLLYPRDFPTSMALMALSTW